MVLARVDNGAIATAEASFKGRDGLHKASSWTRLGCRMLVLVT
jgi:hypothetical protein